MELCDSGGNGRRRAFGLARDEVDQFYRRSGGWGRQVSFNPSPRRDLQRERGAGGCGARGSRRGVDKGLARDSLWLRRVERGSVAWDRRQGHVVHHFAPATRRICPRCPGPEVTRSRRAHAPVSARAGVAGAPGC
jgi:hypothetical protein